MSEEEKKENKNYRKEIEDKGKERYMKKPESEMSEDDKKDAEEMRNLNNGTLPDENRGCTDIICCLMFIAFIGGCAVVTGLGFKNGNPEAISYLYDEQGRPCGKVGTEVEFFPYLYLYNAVKGIRTLDPKVAGQTFCVSECPQSYNSTTLKCQKTNVTNTCEIEAENLYLSKPLLNKICIPDPDLYAKAKENPPEGRTKEDIEKESTIVGGIINTNFINMDKLFEYLGDFEVTWPIMFACVGIAVVVGLLYLVIVKFCGCLIVYLCILLILVLLTVLGWLFQNRMDIYTDVNDTTYRNIQLAFAIIFYSLAFIWLIFILCSCNKIRLAIAISEISSRFIWETLSILLVPIVMFIIISAYIAYWVALSVYLYSSGEIKKSDTTFFPAVEWDNTTRYAWWYHLFSLIYVTAFFEALASFIYSSATCIWYFEQGGEKASVDAPVSRSVWRAFRYHLGSLAFGSLIIAIIRFIMVIVAYIRYQLETGSANNENRITKCYKCLLECILCCLACFEKCFEFINKHAYIMVSVLII